MITRWFYVLVGICLAATVGCASTQGSNPPTPPPTPTPPTLLAQCREVVRNSNDALRTAVRVVVRNAAAGTLVEAMKVTNTTQTEYHVRIQKPSGQPNLITVGQPEVDSNKIKDPSSADDCRPIDAEVNKVSIIKAMGIAQKAVRGSLEKVTFQEYEGHHVYSVITKNSAGKYHLVRVDSDSMKILKREVLGK